MEADDLDNGLDKDMGKADEEAEAKKEAEKKRGNNGDEDEERTPNPAPTPKPSNAVPSGSNRSVSDGQMRVIALLVLLLGLEVLRSPAVSGFIKNIFKVPFSQAAGSQQSQGTSLSALQKMTGRTTN
jgi:hypothetical protein